jgi:hypothetical protein
VGRIIGRGVRVASLTGLAVLAFAGSAYAGYKPFSLTISTSNPTFETAAGETASGETVTITATFKNENTTQQLGSANLGVPSTLRVTDVTVPSPATATTTTCTGAVTGTCVSMRNLSLAPGQSVTLTMNVQTQACAQGSSTWTVEAKQANNFSGTPGNDLDLDTQVSSLTTLLDGACTLAFETLPHDALINQPITGVDWSTTGGPVTVKVLDGSGNSVSTSTAPIKATLGSNPGNATLAGMTVQRTDGTDGTASFADLTLGQPANGYKLAATSGTLTSTTSTGFDVAGTFASCSSGSSCKTAAGNSVGSGQVVANLLSGTGLLLESANANSGAQLNCGGYASADQNTYSFLTTTGATKVVTITITSPAIPLNGSRNKILSAQQICFGVPSQSPNSSLDFSTSSGTPAPYVAGGLPDGSSGYIGLLPNCTRRSLGPCHDRNSDTTVADSSSPLGFDLVLVADIPASFSGDPWSR